MIGALLFAPLLVVQAGGRLPPGTLLPKLLPARRPSSVLESPSAKNYQLVPLRDGSHRYRGERFDATIDEEGSVQFEVRRTRSSLHVTPPVPRNRFISIKDVASLQWHLKDELSRSNVLNLLTPAPGPPRISAYRRLPNAETCFLPDGTNICDCENDGGGTDANGAGNCNEERPNLVVHTTMDFEEEYMRLLGKDPLSREKAAFLTATFEMRLALAARHQAKQLHRGSDELDRRLQELHRDDMRSWREKRRLLFELWLSCDAKEPGLAAGRDKILAFIRENLPRGSEQAYPGPELEVLRTRPGAAEFRPYR
jgi:hypothetical protein